MDPLNYKELKLIIKEHVVDSMKTVVDVGSCDYNGSSKGLFANKHYIGVDLTAGENVDHVMVSEYETGLHSGCADVVLSTSCLEHCRNPFKLVGEMSRLLKTGGLLILSVPQVWGTHRYPKDYWRVLPDGMVELMLSNGIECTDVYTRSALTIRHGILRATFGVGVKR